jgi:hypothetical protein
MPPLLMSLHFGFGRGWPNGFTPVTIQALSLSGISRDSTGAALGSCLMTLYRTRDDGAVASVLSDGSGNYVFPSVSLTETYYIRGYKSGTPDVAGTTVNTLVGV